MLGFVEQDIEDILRLFHVFNEATHGAAGKHGLTKLQHVRTRVENGIIFLAAIAHRPTRLLYATVTFQVPQGVP
ncbi:pPIWI-associating nuclease domain-containing protein [Mesopusillimonas faecipullorum]|uniref:pPIWI-associating nuclease domain-containing protein n=1 Tax=Mesopusillimonas faecipullorum TaxID=2755040 RepID=UPI001D0137D1